MIKLKKPTFNQKDIIDDCMANVKKQPTKKNILSSQSTIENESANYDMIAEEGKLTAILSHTIVEGGANKEDMVWLYDKKFVADGGRKYYDKIMTIPPYGKCPFCGERRVKTLDHFLPKAEYPTFAVTSYNLVASCSDCNKNKKTLIFRRRDEELIHPYYDNFDDDIWLKAKINEEVEIAFCFYIKKPLGWTEEKFLRAKNHFDILYLNDLYKAHAGEVFSEYKYSLKRLYFSGKEKAVKEDLLDRVKEKRSIRKNSWQAAMYDGLLHSNWFFDEYLPKKLK